MKFTQANVKTIGIPEENLKAKFPEFIVFDEEMRGFGVRVLPGQKGPHRSFIAQYKINGRHRRKALGNVAKISLDDARTAAKKLFGKVANGIDPADEIAAARKAGAHSVKKTVEKYLEARKGAMKPRSYDETERHLNNHWQPIHSLTLRRVERSDVAENLAKIAKARGPVAANRSRASLSAFFRWAIGEGLCDNNPVAGTNKQKENGPRERALTDAELAQVYLACDDSEYGRIVRLLIHTGCRREEIGGLEWSEIDLTTKIITLPATRTKNKTEHIVPLTERAVKIIKAIPRRDRKQVFGAGKGGYSGWSKSKEEFPAKLKPWTLHDLRRTVRTGLGNLGVAPHVAEAVLNHLPARLIRTYDRNTYATEKLAALKAWDSHLAVAIAKANGANVTPLRKA